MSTKNGDEDEANRPPFLSLSHKEKARQHKRSDGCGAKHKASLFAFGNCPVLSWAQNVAGSQRSNAMPPDATQYL